MQDELTKVLLTALEKSASDIHISVGAPILLRIHGNLIDYSDKVLIPEETEKYAKELLSDKQLIEFKKTGSVDLSHSISKGSRFRVNIFKQRGSFSIVLRVLGDKVPSFDDFDVPMAIRKLADLKRGLILVTGPTGSGKSTTLAALVDHMNKTRTDHIITIEDPIEFLHPHKKCLINQRELGEDTVSFSSALRGALRQDPDVIMVGEMRDLETIEIALTAAETGHLVLGTLHTVSAAETIERIVDVFTPKQQAQIRAQLANVLQAVVAQQLLPTETGRVAAFEILLKTTAISNSINTGKTNQIKDAIFTGRSLGMISMDASILKLFAQDLISYDIALKFALDKVALKREMEKI